MHFRRGYADHIPIPCIDAVDSIVYERLVGCVNQILSLHDEGAPEDEIAKMDREIDEMIYQLYGITHQDLSFLEDSAGLYM
jgi:hypothetical protein